MKIIKLLITITALIFTQSAWALDVEDLVSKSGKELEQLILDELDKPIDEATKSEVERVITSFLSTAISTSDAEVFTKVLTSIRNVLVTSSSYSVQSSNRAISRSLSTLSKTTDVKVSRVTEDVSYDG